ncbi:hypothetical protein [Pseudomonas sp. xss_2]|uniref:hypothetical protein n=1 Tax=Pseudomonas sp. xss_2 TaxID=3367215 RepID=UPI00370A5AB1
MSGVTISDGIDANVIRNWMPLYRDQPPAALPAFVPLRATAKPPADGAVTIELPFGEQVVTLKLPTSDPEGCVRFVRELLQ